MFSRLNHAYNFFYRRSPVLTLAVINGSLAAASDTLAQTITYFNSQHNPTLPPGVGSSNHSNQEFKSQRYPWHTFDGWRLLRFTIFGVCMAPIVWRWFVFLDKRFPIPSSISMYRMVGKVLDRPTKIKGKLLAASLVRTNKTNGSKLSRKPEVGKSSLVAIMTFKRVVVDQIVWAPLGLAIFCVSMAVMEGEGVSGIGGRLHNTYSAALVANYKVWPLVQWINFRFLPLHYRVPFVSLVGVFWNGYLSWLNNANRSHQ